MEHHRTKLQIGCLLATGGVFALFLILYSVLSTQILYSLDGENFQARKEGDKIVLTGRMQATSGTVTATPTQEGMEFLFDFTPYFFQTYQVTLGSQTTLTQRHTDSEGTLLGEEAVTVRPITVTDGEGAVLLDAFYQDDTFHPFLDQEGNPLEDSWHIQVNPAFSNPALQWEGFEPPLYDMAQLANGDRAPARHPSSWFYTTWGWFALCTVLGGLMSLTIAFPMAWFRLSYFFSVVDPEPTDWYLFTMKIQWGVVPLLLAFGYGWGLFQFA